MSGYFPSLQDLKRRAWNNGFPKGTRGNYWRILLNYVPIDDPELLFIKRSKYQSLVKRYNTNTNTNIKEQIHIDVIRTQPKGYETLLKSQYLQDMLERILYVNAIENTDISYFQGMGDLGVVFIIVFISEHMDPNMFSDAPLPLSTLQEIEADSFWCLKYLLTKLQVSVTSNLYESIQPMIVKLRSLISIVDKSLIDWMDSIQLEFGHFSFRWLLLLLMRELSIDNTIRLWDCYFSEGTFANLHTYVCASIILRFGSLLKKWTSMKGWCSCNIFLHLIGQIMI